MKVIVIGGGAAGLMAAAFAEKEGHAVTVLERNAKVARKVMITGKGRCNVTNACAVTSFLEHVPQNGRFLNSAIRSFGPEDIMSYLENLGVPMKIERGNRVFPVSDQAVDIVDALYRGCKGCRFRFDSRAVELILDANRVTGVRLENGDVCQADAVIVATGGMSYPLTGSTGDGYALARQAGHTVTELTPSLIPLEMADPVCQELMGLSLRNVSLTLREKEKIVYEDFGEMLFTHFGISGPIVLSASAHVTEPKHCTVSIDLKPALSAEQLDHRILRDFEEFSGKILSHALDKLLPKRLIQPILAAAKLDPDLRVAQVTKEMRRRLVKTLKDWQLPVSAFRPIEEAIVTRGGISVKEVDPRSMESKLCRGLFFAGEVLDLDAYTGGFNLQIAFSTGVAAGRGVGQSIGKEAENGKRYGS